MKIGHFIIKNIFDRKWISLTFVFCQKYCYDKMDFKAFLFSCDDLTLRKSHNSITTRKKITKLGQQQDSGTTIKFRLIKRIMMTSSLQDCVILAKHCTSLYRKTMLTTTCNGSLTPPVLRIFDPLPHFLELFNDHLNEGKNMKMWI